MKYITKGIDKSTTIKNIEVDGSWYYKEFMDGSISTYYSNVENEIDKIRLEMVEQAKKRSEIMKPSYYRARGLMFLSVSLLSFTLMNQIVDPQLSGYAILLLIGGLMSFKEFIKSIKIKNELKKYEKFIEMYDDIKTVQNYVHEFEYPILDIETLDKYDNSMINSVYDEYKRTKKLDNN